MTMIETDKEHFKQINIYLADGSRYVIKPLDDGLAKYVKGNFYGGFNIGISKNEAKSIIHEWVFNAERQHSGRIDDIGITASNIISIELLEHEE
jgi:hypothetical protein